MAEKKQAPISTRAEGKPEEKAKDLETALAASRAGLAPETLARLAFARLHPWDRALVHDAHNTAQPASFQLWQAGEQGLVLRCLHLHPAYLELSRRPGALRRTIDAGSLIREQCPDSSRLHVVADSDQAMHISLAPAEQRKRWPPNSAIPRSPGWTTPSNCGPAVLSTAPETARLRRVCPAAGGCGAR